MLVNPVKELVVGFYRGRKARSEANQQISYKEEVLRLLRQGKWPARPNRLWTGGGALFAYESEIMEASVKLKALGEYKLHQLLTEMEAEGVVSHAEHEGNNWVARYRVQP